MAEADEHRYGYNAQGLRVYKPRMGIAGDATGDGQVTEDDLGLLQQALKGETATTMAMDCNQDGVVNRRDTACLASKIGAFKNQGQHQGQGQGGPPTAEDQTEELVQVGWILFVYDEAGHLNTPQLTTDAAGEVVWRADYPPITGIESPSQILRAS